MLLRLSGLAIAAFVTLASATSIWGQGTTFDFSLIADVPYGSSELDDLQQHVDAHNLYSGSDLLAHLGDIMSGGSEQCLTATRYSDVAATLTGLAVPAFIVVGDNEWTGCIDPALAWSHWATHLQGLQRNSCAPPLVESQVVRPENFAFLHKGVLFIGINIPDGAIDLQEEATRLQDDADWVDQQLVDKASRVRGAVVFGHAGPSGSRSLFFDQFEVSAANFGKPVLYAMGDEHAWLLDRPFPDAQNVLRMVLERGTLAEPPVRISVAMDPRDMFLIERDPWPAGTTPLNRAPCADPGPDLSIRLQDAAVLAGLATDDGVPASQLTTTWSLVTGPGSATFGDALDMTTTATFGAVGTYRLRLLADDTVLQSSSEVYVQVRGNSRRDSDADGANDQVDNCPAIPNASQLDLDGDDWGDACDPDVDGDGFEPPTDCDDLDSGLNPLVAENCADGIDNNCDGATDAADLQCGAPPPGADMDGDGFADWDDVCPTTFDPAQADADGDGLGDVCEDCPFEPGTDMDEDGVCADNCPAVYNPAQADADGDGTGDACDACSEDGLGGTCSPIGIVFETRIIHWNDDAEEDAPGSTKLNSSDLELGIDGTDPQLVGLRFRGVSIPQGATITRSFVQFQADESDSGSTSLRIEGEAADDSQGFLNQGISTRTLTQAWAGWRPLDWTSVGDATPVQMTPDLSEIIAEIVDRPGWVSGNALSLIISGIDVRNSRVAESYDGFPAAAPLLHIEYATGSPPTVVITNPADGSIFTVGSAVTLTGTASDPEDGDLTDGIAWSSDLDGALGTGGSVVSNLTLGVHTITGEATDSAGLASRESIAIEMPEPATTLGLASGVGMLLRLARRRRRYGGIPLEKREWRRDSTGCPGRRADT